ncbi:MAG: hypothetical protein P8Y40_13875, partial [Desulfobacterales bacterium]
MIETNTAGKLPYDTRWTAIKLL